MSFKIFRLKDFLSGALAVLLSIYAILKEGIMGKFNVMSFKDNSYLDILQPFCSAECNYLCNFGRGCY